mgnify:FL=1
MANRGIGSNLSNLVDKFIQSINEADNSVKYTGKSVSEVPYLGLRPGNLIEFGYGYGGGRRFGIVLSSQRTSSGLFLSTLNNSLYNVLSCETLDEDTNLSLLNTMYGKESKSTYAEATTVAPLNPPPAKRRTKRKPTFPQSVRDFKTLNISLLSDILKVNLIAAS